MNYTTHFQHFFSFFCFTGREKRRVTPGYDAAFSFLTSAGNDELVRISTQQQVYQSGYIRDADRSVAVHVASGAGNRPDGIKASPIGIGTVSLDGPCWNIQHGMPVSTSGKTVLALQHRRQRRKTREVTSNA